MNTTILENRVLSPCYYQILAAHPIFFAHQSLNLVIHPNVSNARLSAKQNELIKFIQKQVCVQILTLLSSFPNLSVILATCSNGNPIELMFLARFRNDNDSLLYIEFASIVFVRLAVFWIISVVSSPEKSQKCNLSKWTQKMMKSN